MNDNGGWGVGSGFMSPTKANLRPWLMVNIDLLCSPVAETRLDVMVDS